MIVSSPDSEVHVLRAALSGCLSQADEESFIAMLWALNALQTDRPSPASGFFRAMPQGAAANGILGPHAIYPWELETLGNELFASTKASIYRTFDCRDWATIANTVNILRHLEGAEYSIRRNTLNILHEVGRIGARQFEWQRGFLNAATFYRSARIYGQGECARYFSETHGISIEDMTFVGFALMAAFLGQPVLRPHSDLRILEEMGVAPDKLERVLSRLARPSAHVAREARELRSTGEAVAYKPSIFRQYPCILMGPKGRRMYAPLPDLIVNRVTTGLFYDVIGGGGPVRADYGRRFEHYAYELLATMLSEVRFEREWPYRVSGTLFDTPDIIAADREGAVTLVIECKASKMSLAARFGEDSSDERGYEEMAKGVVQLWRFYSHCRRGFTGREAVQHAKGLVLVLDDWFMVRAHMAEKVLQRAADLADRMDTNILAVDRKPVGFTSIAELEDVLRTATRESFFATLDVATSADRRGWLLSSLHQEVDELKAEHRALDRKSVV